MDVCLYKTCFSYDCSSFLDETTSTVYDTHVLSICFTVKDTLVFTILQHVKLELFSFCNYSMDATVIAIAAATVVALGMAVMLLRLSFTMAITVEKTPRILSELM